MMDGTDWQAVFQANATAMLVHDQEGRLLAANAAFCRLAGRSGADMVGGDASFLRIGAGEGEALTAVIGRGEGGDQGGALLRRGDGGRQQLSFSAARLGAGDRQRFVLSLIAAPADLGCPQTIFDHSAGFVGLLDPDGRVVEANPAALALIGKTLAEVAGRPFWETPWWNTNPTAQALVRDAVRRARAGESVRFDTTHPDRSGAVAHIDLSLRPVRDQDGRVVALLPEGRDVTARKSSERALVQARMEAEAANKAKSRFLATMSHELRTPLNAVLGYSEMMLTEIFGRLDNSHYREYVESIHASGRHLLEIINDILDIARIETGTIQLHDEVIDVQPLIGRVARLVQPRARERSIELDILCPTDLPQLYADAQRLRQILLNLLSNAIKFSSRGGTVSAAATLVEGCVEVVIEDSGIGIAADDLPAVWRPFGQADPTVAREFDGVGLGLPIAKHFVEAHGGSIAIDSELGRGTRVIVRFPRERTVVPDRRPATLPTG